MKTVVALPGEGIGLEVIDATCEIITTAGMPVKISSPQIEHPGSPLPEDTRRLCREALMLDHLGLTAEASRLEAALARVYRDGKMLTPDQGGTATTKRMAAEVPSAYRNQR